jgi:two-component system, chemotaxis family, chemotaxis protein CheY
MSNAQPLRVVIIDDNELTRSLLRVILRGALYQVVGEAVDAASGLAMGKSLRPDIILLDNNMPNGNGVDIIKPLKQAVPKAVILMVTTQSEEEMIQAAMDRGASGFVVKPFNTQSVLGTIAKASKHFVLAAPATPTF